MQSFTEENYLKAIYHLSDLNGKPVQTNAIAGGMKTTAASVSDMLRKLSRKELINYVRYQGVTLTEKGRAAALSIIRKHRLWEVFLVEKLKFRWDEVHEIAEEMEHINSPLLIERLDEFLGFPRRDPHGDPIPDQNGWIAPAEHRHLHQMPAMGKGQIIGVNEYSSAFLRHLERVGLAIGTEIEVTRVADYDGSVELIAGNNTISLSQTVARHILIQVTSNPFQ